MLEILFLSTGRKAGFRPILSGSLLKGAALRESRGRAQRRRPSSLQPACPEVELADGFDPRKGVRGGETSRRNRFEGRGTVVALQGVELTRCSLRFGGRRGNLGRDAPADRWACTLRADSHVSEPPTACAPNMAAAHSSAARRS